MHPSNGNDGNNDGRLHWAMMGITWPGLRSGPLLRPLDHDQLHIYIDYGNHIDMLTKYILTWWSNSPCVIQLFNICIFHIFIFHILVEERRRLVVQVGHSSCSVAKPTLCFGDLLGYYHLTGHADEDDDGDAEMEDAESALLMRMVRWRMLMMMMMIMVVVVVIALLKRRKTFTVCENLWRD